MSFAHNLVPKLRSCSPTAARWVRILGEYPLFALAFSFTSARADTRETLQARSWR